MVKFWCFVLGVVGWVFRGYVLSTLWLWFIVPLGVARVSVSVALGLWLLISLTRIDTEKLLQELKNPQNKSDREYIELVAASYALSLTALGAGRICIYLMTF